MEKPDCLLSPIIWIQIDLDISKTDCLHPFGSSFGPVDNLPGALNQRAPCRGLFPAGGFLPFE